MKVSCHLITYIANILSYEQNSNLGFLYIFFWICMHIIILCTNCNKIDVVMSFMKHE